jgi:hypothetical protein
MTPELAAATCQIFLSPDGFEPVARLDPAGMKAVLASRSEYGRPQKILAKINTRMVSFTNARWPGPRKW